MQTALVQLALLAQSAQAETYDWKRVAIGGGGYITGLVAHPFEAGLIYARTDNGGVIRWDPSTESWSNITEHWPESQKNYYGIDGIAVDPMNTSVVYIAAGKSPRVIGAVFKSTDRGSTWKKLKDFYFDANGDVRWAGEPIAVDPNNSNVVYVGTRKEGLYRTIDGGATWAAIPGVPIGATDIGIRTVAISPRQTVGDRSRNIYAGVYGTGVYGSADGGATWSLMPGSPAEPTRMQAASDGTLYVTSASGAYKYQNSWTNISPASYAFTALDVMKDNPSRVIVGADYYLSSGIGPFKMPVYLSNDGGSTWTEIVGKSRWTFEAPWYYSARSQRFSAATCDLQFDPFDPARVYMADWLQVMVTDDVDAPTVRWRQRVKGHEQLSVQGLSALAAPRFGTGAVLYIGAADNRGFRRGGDELDTFPSSWQNVSLEVSGVDFSESDPNQMFEVGGESTGGAAYSMDNGMTWTSTSWPFGGNGRVAVSATDPKLVVVVPRNSAPKRTADRGSTWSSTRGAVSGGVTDFWSAQFPLASDRVNGNTFYYLVPGGDFYRSDDGGANWTRTTNLPVGRGYIVKAAPGIANEVWVAGIGNGLYRSSDGGTSFSKVPNVSRAILVGFGRNPPGGSNPTVFIYGTVSGVEGVYRSQDMGATWTKISDDSNKLGNNPKELEGDRQVYGRVFIGTGGAGVWYGTTPYASTYGR